MRYETATQHTVWPTSCTQGDWFTVVISRMWFVCSIGLLLNNEGKNRYTSRHLPAGTEENQKTSVRVRVLVEILTEHPPNTRLEL
jgi:hypothetical protein